MSALLSVVIPAHNEEGSLPDTLETVHGTLRAAGIAHEIVVVDDHSTDRTWQVLSAAQATIAELRPLKNTGPGGFGNAIHFGLQRYSGDRVTIMMADLSDPPEDLVRFSRAMDEHGTDCVFGSRAMRSSKVVGYPPLKWFLNRVANIFLSVVFRIRCNDLTNPFKLYTRKAMDSILPLTATGFELEIELPVKAVRRGATFVVVPNGWMGRTEGESKMKVFKLFGPMLRMVWTCLKEPRRSAS